MTLISSTLSICICYPLIPFLIHSMVSRDTRVSRVFLNSHMTCLMSKLIAGYTQNNESLVGVAGVQLVHLSIIPGCCSSERRHILHENHFALQCGETEGFSRQQFSRQLVKPSHVSGHSPPRRLRQKVHFYSQKGQRKQVFKWGRRRGAGLKGNIDRDQPSQTLQRTRNKLQADTLTFWTLMVML